LKTLGFQGFFSFITCHKNLEKRKKINKRSTMNHQRSTKTPKFYLLPVWEKGEY